MASAEEVVVAMLTFRRPDHLERALPLLVEQAEAADASVAILVVDNDPQGAAREAVGRWANAGVRYVHEPEPGIAAGRNRALREADGARALVFIDDDETPSADWLKLLVRVWRQTGAAAVTGPVVPGFATTPDPWVVASGQFTRRRHDTGTRMRSAATNNLLLDLARVGAEELRFRNEYGLVGGEDTIFTHELVRRGLEIVWCDEAEVTEYLPVDRLTRRWVLRREFRAGTSYSHMWIGRPRSRGGRVAAKADLTLRGLARIAGAAVRLVWGVVSRDVTHQARGACLIAGNAGLVAGAFGVRFGEYRRPD